MGFRLGLSGEPPCGLPGMDILGERFRDRVGLLGLGGCGVELKDRSGGQSMSQGGREWVRTNLRVRGRFTVRPVIGLGLGFGEFLILSGFE